MDLEILKRLCQKTIIYLFIIFVLFCLSIYFKNQQDIYAGINSVIFLIIIVMSRYQSLAIKMTNKETVKSWKENNT